MRINSPDHYPPLTSSVTLRVSPQLALDIATALLLAELDEAGWLRRATFTGVSVRQRDQTVLSYADRIVTHEQLHLDQIESLLR